MSDLISREKVIDVLKETSIIQDNDLGRLVVDEINRIPTTYDVEAVVEKLENKIKVLGGASSTDAIQDTAVKEIMWCIDIVRSGGKE